MAGLHHLPPSTDLEETLPSSLGTAETAEEHFDAALDALDPAQPEPDRPKSQEKAEDALLEAALQALQPTSPPPPLPPPSPPHPPLHPTYPPHPRNQPDQPIPPPLAPQPHPPPRSRAAASAYILSSRPLLTSMTRGPRRKRNSSPISPPCSGSWIRALRLRMWCGGRAWRGWFGGEGEGVLNRLMGLGGGGGRERGKG